MVFNAIHEKNLTINGSESTSPPSPYVGVPCQYINYTGSLCVRPSVRPFSDKYDGRMKLWDTLFRVAHPEFTATAASRRRRSWDSTSSSPWAGDRYGSHRRWWWRASGCSARRCTWTEWANNCPWTRWLAGSSGPAAADGEEWNRIFCFNFNWGIELCIDLNGTPNMCVELTFVKSSIWENLWSGAVLSKTISCLCSAFSWECFEFRNTSSSSGPRGNIIVKI